MQDDIEAVVVHSIGQYAWKSMQIIDDNIKDIDETEWLLADDYIEIDGSR